jgi:tetratricopeptide (TPR) repeat protein
MASYRQLDAVGFTTRFSTTIGLVALFCCAAPAQSIAQPDTAARVHELFQQERWQEIANLHPVLGIWADTDFEYGIALARLERWENAKNAFRSGLRLSPRDPRFMVELAGVAFKQTNYAAAENWLRRALRLSPKDSYTLDFLGTVFYLQGNIDAALKYWNRIAKPHIDSIEALPKPKLDPILFDRAFAFSPASTLQLSDLRTTNARIQQLDLFPTFRFGMEAQPDNSFNVTFRASERNGCAGNTWACLLVVFGQTPAQTLNFSYFNIGKKAINFESLFRWDAEKRRAGAQIEFPLAGNPKWQLQAGTDLRNENWTLRDSFSGPAPPFGALNLKRAVGFVRFNDVISGTWQWFATTEFSNRDYHNVFAAGVFAPNLLSAGFQLKQSFGVHGAIIRVPERRLNVDGTALLSLARLWSTPEHSYSQLQGSLRLHWFPQHTGEKYEVSHDVRVGKTFGTPPFDELFMLGVLGDTDLQMRAHIATRDGRKGSAPMGRNYFLSNFAALRDVSPIAIAHIKVGPFVDTGNISDPLPQFGSHKWLWDAGLEAKLQAFGFTVTLSYGRDLRSGRNAWVASSP